jgi:hypothetical protein
LHHKIQLTNLFVIPKQFGTSPSSHPPQADEEPVQLFREPF